MTINSHSNRPRRRLTITAAVAAVALGASLSGCTSQTSALPVTTNSTTPSAAPSSTPTPTAVAEADRGSRANPLAVGESRLIGPTSSFTVGASAPTFVGDGYIYLPLVVTIDYDTLREQTADSGTNIDETGVNPYYVLQLKFVSASGQSYDSLETFPAEDIPNLIWSVGDVFPPNTTFAGNFPVSVPADQIAGGSWSVSNSVGDSVFIATS